MSAPTKPAWREIAVMIVFAALSFVAFIALGSVLRAAVQLIKHAVHS